MGALLNCGICCMLTSIWAILQLGFMGVFYWMEAVTLLEDCEAEEYEDYDDFILKTKHNYWSLAVKCWITTAMYLVSLVASIMCIRKAKKDAKIEAKKLENDDYACTPQVPKKKKKIHIKKKSDDY